MTEISFSRRVLIVLSRISVPKQIERPLRRITANVLFAATLLSGSPVEARELTQAELQHFEKLAFYQANEYRGTIAKFVEPVIFSIHGNPTKRDLALLRIATRDVAANVPHTFRYSGEAPGNLRVIYSDDLKNLIVKDFASSLKKLFLEGDKMVEVFEKKFSNETVHCLNIPVVRKGEIIVQYVFVKTNLKENLSKKCVIEYILSAIGLSGYLDPRDINEAIKETALISQNDFYSMTELDIVAARVLYSEKVHPGMAWDEFRKLLPFEIDDMGTQ